MRPRKPVCVKCEKTLKPYHNGAHLVELYNDNQLVYKIWKCDIYQCPVCGMKIVYGFGDKPILTNVNGEKICRDYLEKVTKEEGSEFIVYNYEQGDINEKIS